MELFSGRIDRVSDHLPQRRLQAALPVRFDGTVGDGRSEDDDLAVSEDLLDPKEMKSIADRHHLPDSLTPQDLHNFLNAGQGGQPAGFGFDAVLRGRRAE